MRLGWKKRRSVCVCSWCRTVISINDYAIGDGTGTTHGLCETCMERLEARSLAPSACVARLRARST